MTGEKPQVVAHRGMGPYFWAFTAALTAINVLVALYVMLGNIDWMMPSAGAPVADRASDIDGLFKFMSIFGNAIFVYVAGYVLYFVAVFRRKPGESLSTVGPSIHDSHKLELWWTIIPSILLIVLTVLTINVWHKIYYGDSAAAPALTMEVIAHQFQFEYRYPGLSSSIWSGTVNAPEPASVENAMHLPLGKTVRLLISSGDVLHNFWVPEIRLKAGAVPGLVQVLNFTPTHTGTFDVICAEYCGVNHSLMQGKVVIEPADQFETWLAGRKSHGGANGNPTTLGAGSAIVGAKVFAAKCSACHSTQGFTTKIVGPGLGNIRHDPGHLKLVNGDEPTPQNVARLIQNGYNGPIGVMPNSQANGLTSTDIANVVAYILSLK